ncbi:Scr1 family TA system antitoxin-like transcriptional regulator [Pseudonocardia sp. CA-107938]|uniref:Scr1 family TA system antitoxin-like transcriptional regulator n=1 Tax=Pseudonocardia sp. CA-107938 TaxID=3240021 RepID=UPI003D8BD501
MPQLLITLRGSRRQVDFAKVVGLTQAKLSRLEQGQGPPLDPEAAAAFAAAAGATPEQAARLVELAEVSTATHYAHLGRTVVLRNAHVIQGRIRDYMATADYVWSWSSNSVSGVLQTRAWTKAMLAGDDDGADPGPEWWARREERTALLDDPARSWRFLLYEGALRWIVDSRAVQAELVEHIAEVSTREHVEIAVIDQSSPKPLTATGTFLIYGERAAEVSGALGPAYVEDPADLAVLRGIFERLWAQAHQGDDARELLARIARSIRGRRGR